MHESGIPWRDDSGDRLRAWTGLTEAEFYDGSCVALVPMGFCYPGKGASGDLPPRPECAPLWHARVLAALPERQLTLLVGSYAQQNYLGAQAAKTLTETVRRCESYLPAYLPLPHPSWRSTIWMTKNPWFGETVVPILRQRVRALLD